MRAIARLVVVVTAAVGLFVWAFIALGDPPDRECLMESVSDPSYQVRVEEVPTVDVTTYHLRVTRNDRPVQGARVCVRLDMGGRSGTLSALGASNLGRELAPGRYAVPIQLIRAGPWQGEAVVTEPGRRPVMTPLVLDVR